MNEDRIKTVMMALEERLEILDNNRKEVQEAVETEYQRELDELNERKSKFTDELMEAYNAEDGRLQEQLSRVRTALHSYSQNSSPGNATEIDNALESASAALLMKQTYHVDLPEMKLKPTNTFVPSTSTGGSRNITVACNNGFRDGGVLDLDLKVPFAPQEKDVLSNSKIYDTIKYRIVISSEDGSYDVYQTLLDETEACTIIPSFLVPETSYSLKARAECGSLWYGEWSNPVPLRTPKMSKLFSWQKCTEGPVLFKRMYEILPETPCVAKKINRYGDSTVIGNTVLPAVGKASWSIKLRALGHGYTADGIYIGIAPYNINQNKDNNDRSCGWYLRCFDMSLFSGPPHSYKEIRYYKGTERPPFLAIGDKVDVLFDAGFGDLATLAFKYKDTLDMPAYENIPIDKPLVPVVLLYWNGDCVECTFNENE